MSYRLLTLAFLLPAAPLAAQGVASLQLPKDLRAPTVDQRLQVMPRDLDLGITGQGSLTVAGQTCTSKLDKDYTGCSLKVIGMNRYEVVATPSAGTSLAAWHWSCADSQLDTKCMFKPSANVNGNKISVTFVKGVPVSLVFANGPGTVNQKVEAGNAPVKSIQCWSDAAGKQTGSCKMIAVVGSTIVLKPLDSEASAFKAFSSSASGCNGATCSFTVSGPTTITARFQPMATMIIDASFPMKMPVIITSKGGNTFVCIDDTNKSQTTVGSMRCTAHVEKGSTLVANLWFDPNKPGTGVLPVSPERVSGACAGQPAGTCSLVMDGNKQAAIAYALH